MVSLFPLSLPCLIPLTPSQSLLLQLDSPIRQQGHEGGWAVYKEWGSLSLVPSLRFFRLPFFSLCVRTECMQSQRLSNQPKRCSTDSQLCSSVKGCHFYLQVQIYEGLVPLTPVSFRIGSINPAMEQLLVLYGGCSLEVCGCDCQLAVQARMTQWLRMTVEYPLDLSLCSTLLLRTCITGKIHRDMSNVKCDLL